MMQIRNSKGFTMIEMLVVVSIIAIFTSIAIANFPQDRRQFDLSQATYKFAQDIKRAQNMAMASSQYTDSNGVVRPVVGYGVAVSQFDYIIYARSPSNPNSSDLTYNLNYDYKIEQIFFTQSSNVIVGADDLFDGTLFFTPPLPTTTLRDYQGTNLTIANVTFVSRSSTLTKIVSINSAGLIEVQ